MDEKLLKRAERRRRKLERRRQRELPLFAHAGLLDQVEPLPEVDDIADRLSDWDRAYTEQRERARREAEEAAVAYCAVLRHLGHDVPELPGHLLLRSEYVADYYYRALCAVYPRARELWLQCIAAGRSLVDFRALLLAEVGLDLVANARRAKNGDDHQCTIRTLVAGQHLGRRDATAERR